MKTNYYQIDFTLDKKIRGRYEMPHTVELPIELIEYKKEKCKDIWTYFNNINSIYSEMPNILRGKLYKRKDTVDFIDTSPFCLSLKYIVSEKVKNILTK
ncbi:MAG: hypothetical protein Q4G63_13115, partial [Bacteroidia bacterium]|nr:hypothetical protein [Bacteroidia bacterium]